MDRRDDFGRLRSSATHAIPNHFQRIVSGATPDVAPARQPIRRPSLSALLVQWRVLGHAEQVALRVGEGGPPDVGHLVENVPLVRGAEPDQALNLGFPRTPWDGEVPVGHLVLDPGRGPRLEEHPESTRPVGRQVDAVPAGRGFRSSDRRPERGQGGGILGLQVDGTEGDLVV